MSIKSSFGICRKSGEITNQVIGTKNEIVPGTLLKIILVNKKVISDRFDIIKLYDRNTERFSKELFQCDKGNIKQLDDNLWLFVSKLRKGDNIKINMEMPDNNVDVQFCIKCIGEVPEFGAGVFYIMDLIDNPKLSDYHKYLIRMKYSINNKSTICMRGDRLIEGLLVQEPTSFQLVKSCVEIHSSAAHNPLQSTPAISTTSEYISTSTVENLNNHMLNVPEVSLIDFDAEVQFIQPHINFDDSPAESPVHCNLNQMPLLIGPHYANMHNDCKINEFGQELWIEQVKINQSNGISSNKVPVAILSKINKQNNENSSVQQQENYRSFALPTVQQEGVILIENSYAIQTGMNIPEDRIDPLLKTNLLDLQKESNGMNEYASMNNLHKLNVIDQDIQAINKHVMPYQASIVAKIVKQNFENSSIPENYKQFKLPTIQQDESLLSNDYLLSQLLFQPTKSYVRNNSSSPPNNAYPTRSHRNRGKNQPNLNNITTDCYICSKDAVNSIQLNCQHIFCLRCLAESFSNVENAKCPFKKDNYQCTLKLNFDDIKFILEGLNKEYCDDSKILTMPKSAASNVNLRPAINQVEQDVFVYNTDNSNEVIFCCKKNNCKGVWILDKTERDNIYSCPVCDTYNCVKCEAIHSNMSCEEYNQKKSVHQNNKQISLSHHAPNKNQLITSNDDHKWICEFCEYSDNLMNTAICVFCARTNEKIRAINNDLFNMQKNSIWICQFCSYTDNSMDSSICLICLKNNKKLAKIKKSIDTEYYHLLELEENDTFIPSFVEFECIICAEMVKPDNGVQLRGCLHQICLICIRKYIEGLNQSVIKCPFVECTNILEDREIRSMVLPDVYERHLEKSLRIGKSQIENGYQCCVTNCPGWWIFTKGIYKYECPVCVTENCISCKASHPNIDCKTYQQNLIFSTDKNGIETRLKLEQMLRTGEAEHCPKCNIVVVKNGGCDVMYCSMCRTSFNWGLNPNKNLNII